MTEQDTLAPISDQEELIQDAGQENHAPKLYTLLKFGSFVFLLFGLLVCNQSKFLVILCFFVAASFGVIDLLATALYYGAKLVGISWKITFGEENMLSYTILPEPEMPDGETINTFWVLETVSVIFWIIIPFILLASFSFKVFFVFFLVAAAKVANYIIFLRGNAIASKQSAEAIRNVLLGDEFQELPEQATIESTNKTQEVQSTVKVEAQPTDNKEEETKKEDENNRQENTQEIEEEKPNNEEVDDKEEA